MPNSDGGSGGFGGDSAAQGGPAPAPVVWAEPVASGDPMQAAMRELLRRVDADHERLGWGRPPRLYAVTREAAAAGPGGSALVVLGVEPFPLPAQAWSGREPPLVVGAVAGMVRDGWLPEVAAAVAVVLVVEVWTTEDLAEDPAVTGRRLADHPGRGEGRSVLAVDAAGGRYALTRVRGGGVVAETTAGEPESPPVRGLPLDVLAELMEACQSAA